ncbi:MAG: PAS domain S-box protein [Desulfobacteraceae bacterium]|nr:PAS domain S-box protein [Desulfobacteraceae bacterium]
MLFKLIQQNVSTDETGDFLLFWKERMFFLLFLSLVILGIVPYLTGLAYAVQRQDWLNVYVYTGFYIYVIAFILLRRIPFCVRVRTGLFFFYFMGLFTLFTSGMAGSARLSFICFSVFAGIFTGVRGGVVTLCMNAVTLFGAGFLHYRGYIVLPNMLPLGVEDWFLISVSSVFLNTVLTLIVAVLVRAIDESGKKFRLLADNTVDMIWILDREMRFTYVSPCARSMFGYGQAEWIGSSFKDHLPWDMIEAYDRFVREEPEKKEHLSVESVMLHKDGTRIHVEIIGTRIHDPGGNNLFQGSIRNITRRKQLEAKQETLRERLFRAEKMEALGLLSSGVAHDLNNILSGIATYPEILLMGETLEEPVRKGLDTIKESGRKAADIVSDLLTISRGRSAEFEVIDINRMVENYLDSPEYHRLAALHPNVELVVEPASGPLNVRASYVHMEKSLMNLVINAVEEVSGKLGGRVVISTAVRRLTAPLRGYESVVPGEYNVVTVCDNGSGIKESALGKIFEPFYSKKEMGRSGTGLGLTIVWNTVQDHGGYVEISSGAKGTRFDLFFPSVAQAGVEKPREVSMDEVMGTGQAVLVVDDLPAQQEIACRALDLLGYESHGVGSGHEALAFIKKRRVDLVVLDMIMDSGIGGFTTYREMKKLAPGLRAVVASGYATKRDVIEIRKLGAGSFIQKPYTIVDLGKAIKEELTDEGDKKSRRDAAMV